MTRWVVISNKKKGGWVLVGFLEKSFSFRLCEEGKNVWYHLRIHSFLKRREKRATRQSRQKQKKTRDRHSGLSRIIQEKEIL